MRLKSVLNSTHMDRSLSFGVERRNSSSELMFRVCFLMCLWPRRKIWTVTKGDIHRKSQRSDGQLAKFFSMEGAVLQSEKEYFFVPEWLFFLPRLYQSCKSYIWKQNPGFFKIKRNLCHEDKGKQREEEKAFLKCLDLASQKLFQLSV